MSSRKSLKQQRIERAHPVERVPLITFFVRKILDWPRFIRIAIISVFALAVTALVFPLVDFIYMSNFFSEETRILPSFVSAAFAIITYILGWWLIVGMRGERRPERIAAIFIYIIFGFLVMVFVLILMVNGYSSANLPV